MIAVNILRSTEFDEFDATDVTEEDIDQFERRRARIVSSMQDAPAVSCPLPLTHSTYPLSCSEELVNSITHGIGLILSVIGAVVMAVALVHGDVWRVTGCGIYLVVWDSRSGLARKAVVAILLKIGSLNRGRTRCRWTSPSRAGVCRFVRYAAVAAAPLNILVSHERPRTCISNA